MPITVCPQRFTKQHTCTACGCLFRYHYDLADWRTTAMSQTMRPGDSIRIHPCPDCGVYQPEMVMWQKVLHPIVAILTLPAVGVVIFLYTGAAPVLAAEIGVGLFFLIALLQAGAAWYDPNADLDANRARAQKEMAAGELVRVAGGTPDEVRRPRNLTAWHAPALLGLLAAPLLFLLAVQRLSQQGLQVWNPKLSPSVVGPGDTARFTLTRGTAQGVTGKIWRGTPTVRLLGHQELGAPETLLATGSNREWGEKVQVPVGSVNQTIQPTIQFTLPNSPKLAGQTVRLQATLPMTFPQTDGAFRVGEKRRFHNATATVVETFEVRVADEAAARSSREAIVLALAAYGLSLLGGVWLTTLAWLLVRRSSKWEVVPAHAAGAAAGQGLSGYEMIGLADHPAAADVDLSKWGGRALDRRPRSS